jgi:hypothetical protein
MPMPFRQHMDVLSKSPAPTHGLAGQEPGKRQAGWSFSLVTFSLATQRESDSVAEGDRPLFCLNATKGISRKRAPAEALDCSAPMQHPPPPKSLDACFRRHDGYRKEVEVRCLPSQA